MTFRLTISNMQNAAKHFGGRCLSKEYAGNEVPLKWMCAKGHTWEGTYMCVQKGIWCVQCIKEERINLWKTQLVEIVSKKGGVCLSENFINQVKKLQFKCANGHQFSTRPQTILSGSWCKQCMKENNRERAFNRLKTKAAKKGGKILSKDYGGKYSVIKLECAKGHTWSVRAFNLDRGLWCSQCKLEEKHQRELKKLNDYAKTRGGKCLTTEYKRKNTPFLWECRKGHQWKAEPSNVTFHGTWCPVCGHEDRKRSIRKHTVEELQQIAQKRGGKLLSKVYYNSKSLLKWECYNGHTWWASFGTIYNNNSWCRKCYRENQKFPIEKFQQIAKRHKGKLLSKEYHGIRVPLKFECVKGHRWIDNPKNILNSKWCPVCTKRKIAPEKIIG